MLLIVGIGHAAIGTAAPQTAANSTDNLTGLAQLIFTTYVFPFEVTSALLITAALGGDGPGAPRAPDAQADAA